MLKGCAISALLALAAPFSSLAQQPLPPTPDPSPLAPPARSRPVLSTPSLTGVVLPPPRWVLVNQKPVSARAEIDIQAEPREYREGTSRPGPDPAPRGILLPGTARYGVCVVSKARIASLDASILGAKPQKHTVHTEEGIRFDGCVVAGLRSRGPIAERDYTYCLRCASAK
jgi:hypothetical protein